MDIYYYWINHLYFKLCMNKNNINIIQKINKFNHVEIQ